MIRILVGDALEKLRELPNESVQCVVTSPPYWVLRDYGVDGQIGLERTPGDYVRNLASVFCEVNRVLRCDGTLWLNLGDCYATGAGKVGGAPGGGEQGARWAGYHGAHAKVNSGKAAYRIPDDGLGPKTQPNRMPIEGLKPKDLVGIPWRVAFALQSGGWWLRSDIVWHKPNPMPESVSDRPTRAHDYIFLLSKSLHYFYDHESIKERVTGNAHARGDGVNPKAKTPGPNSRAYVDRVPKPRKQNPSFSAAVMGLVTTRNKRSVWTVASEPYTESHFATFPTKLVEPCILAGSREGDTVLDPFCGAGTTGLVAARLKRDFIGIELNAEYAAMAERRIRDDAPLLNYVEVIA